MKGKEITTNVGDKAGRVELTDVTEMKYKGGRPMQGFGEIL